ncbi:MAG: Ig-like domain-containing protein [candidate division WOR-3 bacterium]|nr:MAG: Ig-like domain-containing protein [candidate division WOR-3 bacterium]
MSKTILILFVVCTVLLVVTCGERQEEIDMFTQLMIQTGDTIPLKITHVSPIGKTEGTLETFKILVGFNQPMVPLQQIEKDEKSGPLQIEPKLQGKYRWMGTRTLAFIPDDTLMPATKFTVRLKKENIRSLTGMALTRDTSWSFESVRPRLLSSIPYHNAQFIELDANIYLNFNTAMSPKRVRDKIKIYYTKGMPSRVWCGQMKSKTPHFRGELSYRVRNLSDDEKEEYPLKHWDNSATLVLMPRDRLPIESQIEVVLYPGLLAEHGNLGAEDENIIRFNTYNEFSLVGFTRAAPGEGALQLCFSNRVVMKDVVKHLFVEPAVDIPPEYAEDDWSTNEVYLYLPFVHNKEHNIRISKDLRDIYGNRLVDEYGFKFKRSDFTPHVEMPTGINLIESESDLRIPFTFVNADSVYIQLARLSIDQAIPFLNTPELFWSGKKFVPQWSDFFDVSRVWHVDSRKKFTNQQRLVPFELTDILGSKRSGLIFLQLDNLNQNRYSRTYRYSKSFVEISDIGVTWKYSPENNLIWATSLNDAKPMNRVRVQIRNNDNRILWEGLSDSSGFCEAPGWHELGLGASPLSYETDSEYESYEWSIYEEPKFWLTLTRAGDAAVYSNQWHFGIDPWRFNISYEWYAQPEAYEAFLFTEKGLYRAGESVHLKGIMRKKRKGQWVLPDVNRIVFKVRNARDEEIIIDTIQIDRFGSFTRNISLDAEAPTGVYAVTATLTDRPISFYQSFRVEAYRPAEFEVKVTADKDTFIAGEAFKGIIEGKYLFGMPMKDATVSWNIRRSHYRLRFPMHEGYLFGEYEAERERELLGSGTGKLDKNGTFAASIRLSGDDIYSPSLLFLEGTITAPNMTTVSKEQNWLALNAEYLIGLKTDKYLYVLNDTVSVNVITVNTSGERIRGRNITVDIYRREWKSIKKARLGGRYEWVSERVDTKVSSQKVKSGERSSVQVIPDVPGYYYARAYGKDGRGRMSTTRRYYYVAGRGNAGWEMRDDDIIEVVADKEQYDVGDTARILVKSPYDSARCLVTVERELVLDKFTRVLRGNADYIELPIESEYLPNIYVSVMLLRGRVRNLRWDDEKQQDLGKPQFKIGYLNLMVNAAEKRLQVSVRPDRNDYGPRDTVALDLVVRDNAGKPVAGSDVALFVVDLGVLNLIDFKTPDPFKYFYGTRPLAVRTIESRVNILGERDYGEKGEERGGGGAFAEGVSYREKFIATAFYRGAIETDRDGRARARFELPDNLTKFRIMAVAQTKNSQFGSAESTFVVSLPYMITPSIPRFLRVGDEFRAGIVLHNRTDRKEKATVECRATGLEQLEPRHRELTLMPNTSTEVLFRFNARTTGEATFEFKSHLGEETDALRLKIPIIIPPLFEAVATSGSTIDSSLEAIIVPSQADERLGGIEISLSPTFLAGMDQGIDFLWNYPYYCLEQILSKILPLITGGELIDQFKLAPVTGRALRDTVQSVLNTLKDYQTDNGGFVYFKGSRSSCPYLSAYTLYVLYRARNAGYNVDQQVITRGIGFLRDVLRWQDVDWTYPYDEDARLTTKAFCLYSLTLWGIGEQAYAARLFERRNKLSIFGKVMLLRTGRMLHMGGNFESEIRTILVNKVMISHTTAHFEETTGRGWTFPSPAKVTAAVIQAFMEMDIPFPYSAEVMRWLVQERTKRAKPTTHENAFVFDAFLTYYKKYERDAPDFTARVLLGAQELVKQSFRGRSNIEPERFHVSFERVPKDSILPVIITKEGIGRLYYTMRMKYALAERPYPYDGGFYVWKEILSVDDKPVWRFKRGEVYKVVVHVVTPETRLFAVVEDPIPAGFVPVQSFMATESRAVRERYSGARYEERGHWWGGFNHTEFYDDRVLFFAEQLFPGEHTKIYYIRAASGGKFLRPQTQAQEMYSPEVFGNSNQSHVIIR